MSRELLEEIRQRILELPKRKQDELGVAGAEEQRIAILYFKLGEHESCGDWWVRSAQEAERFGQLIVAHQRLVSASKQLPLHLTLRRELARLTELLNATLS